MPSCSACSRSASCTTSSTCSSGSEGSRNFLIGGGAFYLLLGIYDAIVGQESNANWLPTNNGDTYLHLALGVGMLALGFALRGRRPAQAGYTESRRGQTVEGVR